MWTGCRRTLIGVIRAIAGIVYVPRPIFSREYLLRPDQESIIPVSLTRSDLLVDAAVGSPAHPSWLRRGRAIRSAVTRLQLPVQRRANLRLARSIALPRWLGAEPVAMAGGLVPFRSPINTSKPKRIFFTHRALPWHITRAVTTPADPRTGAQRRDFLRGIRRGQPPGHMSHHGAQGTRWTVVAPNEPARLQA
jgi:hypothetical protein